VQFDDGIDVAIDLGYLRHLGGVFEPVSRSRVLPTSVDLRHRKHHLLANEAGIAPETLYAHALLALEVGR
jgi:hypothetical protein